MILVNDQTVKKLNLNEFEVHKCIWDGKEIFNNMFKIGLLVPLTGPNGEKGQEIQRFYQAMIRENFGSDRQIELCSYDTRSESECTITAYNEAKDRGICFFILYGSFGEELANRFDDNGDLAILIDSDNFDETDSIFRNVFSAHPKIDSFLEAVVDHIQKEGSSKVGILYPTDFDNSILIEKILERGLDFVSLSAIDSEQSEYQVELMNCQDTGADRVLLVGFDDDVIRNVYLQSIAMGFQPDFTVVHLNTQFAPAEEENPEEIDVYEFAQTYINVEKFNTTKIFNGTYVDGERSETYNDVFFMRESSHLGCFFALDVLAWVIQTVGTEDPGQWGEILNNSEYFESGTHYPVFGLTE